LNDQVPLIRIKCLQTLQSLFGHKDLTISVPYIHALTPSVVVALRKHLLAENEDSQGSASSDTKSGGENDAHRSSSQSVSLDTAELPVVIEAERALEIVISMAQEDKRLPLLALLVHILMSFIRDPQSGGAESQRSSLSSSSPIVVRQLHEYALQRLNVLGPNYVNDFKIILSQFPDLKSRLERAVRSQHHQSANALSAASMGAGRGGKQGQASQQPTIKLTTDFSNFVRS